MFDFRTYKPVKIVIATFALNYAKAMKFKKEIEKILRLSSMDVAVSDPYPENEKWNIQMKGELPPRLILDKKIDVFIEEMDFTDLNESDLRTRLYILF